MNRDEQRTSGDGSRGSEDFPPANLDAELRREFLVQAGLLNAGVLGAGFGLLLLTFSEKLSGGVVLLVTGAVLLLLAGWRYRRHCASN
ncbi:MAG: hypothetical protein ABEJ84_00235 [Halodesulfurarchaeum sp.]